MLNANRISLIPYLKIIDDITICNSFLKLNMNSNGLWSDFRKKIVPRKKNFRGLFMLHAISSGSFIIFDLFVFAAVDFLDWHDIEWLSCDVITTLNYFPSNLWFTLLLFWIKDFYLFFFFFVCAFFNVSKPIIFRWVQLNLFFCKRFNQIAVFG